MPSKTDISYPVLPPYETTYKQQQEQRVLPRNIFASGTLPGNTVIRIGDKNITFDGENRRIIVSDGTDDRVLIGFDEDGF